MFLIRESVFETNSSSVHAICVSNEYDKRNIPECLNFKIKYFTTFEEHFSSVEDRASYLYGLMICFFRNDKNEFEKTKNKIFEELFDAGCKCSFEDINDEYCFPIDAPAEAMIVLNKCIKSKKMLFGFLFGEDSEIYTWSDSDENCWLAYKNGLPLKNKNTKVYWKFN